MTAMTTKPFRILGLQQIAIGAPDKGPLRTLWCDIFGLATKGQFRSERENVDEDICALGHGPHEIEVDLMQPIDPNGKPAVHATPLNHVGLWVDDLARAVEWMTANGVRFAPGGIRKGAAGHDICFIHPKANAEFPIGGEGVLIELVQAPAGIIRALASGDVDVTSGHCAKPSDADDIARQSRHIASARDDCNQTGKMLAALCDL